MNIKNLAKASFDGTESKIIKKIDKQIDSLLELKCVQNIILLADRVESEVIPIFTPDENFGKSFIYDICASNTYPVSLAIKYEIDGNENEVSLDDVDIKSFNHGFKLLIAKQEKNESKNKLTIDYSFKENLIKDIIGKKLFNEYFEAIENCRYNMYQLDTNS